MVVRECRRCLVRAGVFAVSTNSARNKPEMHSFHRRLMRMHGLERVGAKRGSERFPAENAAAILRQYFDHVLDVPYTGRFRFADAGEFLEYYASTTNFKLAVRAGEPRGIPSWPLPKRYFGSVRSGRCPTTERSCSRAVLLTAYGLSPMARTRRGMPVRHAPRGSPGDEQDGGFVAHPPESGCSIFSPLSHVDPPQRFHAAASGIPGLKSTSRLSGPA